MLAQLLIAAALAGQYDAYGATPENYTPASFTEVDYARNPTMGVSPRVRVITKYVIPNVVYNDTTSGASKAQKDRIKKYIKDRNASFEPLPAWKPSVVKERRKRK